MVVSLNELLVNFPLICIGKSLPNKSMKKMCSEIIRGPKQRPFEAIPRPKYVMTHD